MRRSHFIGLVVIAAVASNWPVAAQPPVRHPAQANRVQSEVMRDKLDRSKDVLEGIALADFAKISRSADRLIQLSKTAEWKAIKSPRYELHTNEFQRAAESLIAKADSKNLDGVTLAYFDLTTACVRCHQHVRETRDARLDGPHDKAGPSSRPMLNP